MILRSRTGIRLILLLVICLVGSPAAHTSGLDHLEEINPRFSRLSLEQGLSQSTVNCILQDHRGMMWFGTQDGLNRFDGYEFIVYKHDPADPGSLSHNFIWALLEDSDGMLWIGTEGGGLDRWNPGDDSFEHMRHDEADPFSLGNDVIRSLVEGHDGSIWIGTDGGLGRYDRETGKFHHFTHREDDPKSLSDDRIRCLYVDRNGTLWIGTEGGGIDRHESDGAEFRHFRHDPDNAASLSNDRIRTIGEGADGSLWIGTYEGGLNRLDTTTGRIERYRHDPSDDGSLGHDRVRALLVDSDDVLWVGTDRGLSRMRPEPGEFLAYRHDAADPYSLSNDRVLSLYQDRGGLLWVATQAGLNCWHPTLGSFAHYRQDGKSGTTLSSGIVTALGQDPSGQVWIGTYGGGLNILDRNTRTFSQVLHEPGDPDSLADDRVMSLWFDRSGVLWIGTFADGLDRLDPATGKIRHYRHRPEDPGSLSANGVTVIRDAPDGTLWIGTYGGGLNRLDGTTDAIRRYRHDPDDPTTLSDDRIMSIHHGSDGFVWVGTAGGGLNRLNPATGNFVRFRNDPHTPGTLASDVVWAIHEDGNGTMWLGTQGGGLNRWNPEDRRASRNRFRAFSEKDGLPNAFIYGILEDDDGSLWLSSNKGISRFDSDTGTFTNFNATHGLQSNEFNFGAYFRNENGEMLFGGNNGFNLFHPERIRANPHVPPVLLTGIYKLNEPAVLHGPPWDLQHLELDWRDRVVSFDFAALDFSHPDRNRYAYQLVGFDPDWIDLGNRRRITYTNLDPGEYVLRVRGSNNDGVWNLEGVSLPIRALPPPWRTWWAYLLYGTVLTGVVLAYTRAQARKMQREAEYSKRLENEVRERTGELASRNRELATLNDRLEEASLTDPLTGLRNRRYLVSFLKEDVALVQRAYRNGPAAEVDGKPPVTDIMFLMLDLDGFKQINDTHGHLAGDRVLLAVCEALEKTCRRSDTIVRWGGDEFLVIGRNVGRTAAEGLADRIVNTVHGLRIDIGAEDPVRIACSVGFAFFPFLTDHPGILSWEQVVTIADRALYISKESGRNAWCGITGMRFEGSETFLSDLLESPEKLAATGMISIHGSRKFFDTESDRIGGAA